MRKTGSGARNLIHNPAFPDLIKMELCDVGGTDGAQGIAVIIVQNARENARVENGNLVIEARKRKLLGLRINIHQQG